MDSFATTNRLNQQSLAQTKSPARVTAGWGFVAVGSCALPVARYETVRRDTVEKRYKLAVGGSHLGTTNLVPKAVQPPKQDVVVGRLHENRI